MSATNPANSAPPPDRSCADATWCGKYYGYAIHGCRGEACTTAQRVYARKRRGSTRVLVMDDDARDLRHSDELLEVLDIDEETQASRWMTRAACAGEATDTFFPHEGIGTTTAAAVCASCPVSEECLEYALRHRIAYGIWGGASERTRARILRKRRTA